MYNLCVQGVNDFYARRPGAKRLIRREPLSGIVDGVNTTFLTNHPTWLLDSLRVYVGTAIYAYADLALYDANGGVVGFNAAPSTQPLADYSSVPLTTDQVVIYAWAGFELLERLWTRKLALSSSATVFTLATYTDPNIYIVNGANAGDIPTEPIYGTTPFSQSNLQRMCVAQCIELAYMDSMLSEAALTDVDYRERLTGVAINSMGRTKNILSARDALYQNLRQTIYAAMQEAGDGEQYADQSLPETPISDVIWNWGGRMAGGQMVPGSLLWTLT